MRSTFRERKLDGWIFPARALHKLYRLVYETPRRKRIASKVLDAPPSRPVDTELPFSTHMLVCSRDVPMALCTAKTANLAFDMALPWVFHDDGSLTDEEERYFRTQLPGCTVVRRAEGDQKARELLQDYPEILKYRDHQVMALKLVDVKLWSRGDRLAYIDSDIVFFQTPEFFIDSLKKVNPGNYFNRDISSSYVRPSDEIGAEVGVRPTDRLNAGLWVMSENVIDLDRIEGWLRHPAFAGNLWDYTLDQTFISMLATVSEHGVEHLPSTYDVAFRKPVDTSVNKHYVGAIRHAYELEGLRYVLEELDFADRWRAFTSVSRNGVKSRKQEVASSARTE